MSNYLIIGSGISGCSAGFELAELGHEVHIAETGSRIGGKVLSYCCKATEECSRCGVCVAHTKLSQVLKHRRIHFSTGAEIRAASTHGRKISIDVSRSNPSIDYHSCIDCGRCVVACPEQCITRLGTAEVVQYSINLARCVLQNGEACTACAEACPTGAISCGNGATESYGIEADGVLVATGHEPFDAVRKLRYGYGRLDNVITGVEAEATLAEQDSLGEGADSVAFIQCVGSRDPQIGNNYCSSVCCAYALRLARIVKHRTPQTEVTIYYIDIQNFDKTFTVLREELINSGIRFVRGVPFRVERASNGKLKLYGEGAGREESISEHDVVVLSVGMEPAPGTEALADLFKIERDEFGFLRDHKQVYISGTCREPQSIVDSMASARATALRMVGEKPPTEDGTDGGS